MIFSQSEGFDGTLEELEYTTATSSFAAKDRIEPTASQHFSRSTDFADSMYEGTPVKDQGTPVKDPKGQGHKWLVVCNLPSLEMRPVF